MNELITEAVLEAAIEEVAMGQTFKFVGFATSKKGNGKLRFTNDKRRTRSLVRAGMTDVKFVELPNPMSKQEIIGSMWANMVMPVVAQEEIISENMQKEVDISQ